jgi:hypothetical protein
MSSLTAKEFQAPLPPLEQAFETYMGGPGPLMGYPARAATTVRM